MRIIPDHLRYLALLGCYGEQEMNDVEVRYKMCHLFANIESERTNVDIIHKKS